MWIFHVISVVCLLCFHVRLFIVTLWFRGQTDIYGLFCEFVAPPGRKSLLLFSVMDMSWGIRNPCFTKFSVVSFL